jgi:hypothetical protein
VDVTVWVDEWQFDCCGEPFGVGSVVSWRIGPTSDFLADMLGPGAGVTIDAFEDHHIGLPAGTPPTRGTVLAIHGAYQRYAHRGKGDPTRYPVSGSGVLVLLAREAVPGRPRRSHVHGLRRPPVGARSVARPQGQAAARAGHLTPCRPVNPGDAPDYQVLRPIGPCRASHTGMMPMRLLGYEAK